MIRAALRLLVIYLFVWFLSLNWDGAYTLVEASTKVLASRIMQLPFPGLSDSLQGLLVFFVAALGWMLLQLPLWISAVAVDKLRGPLGHPFARQPLRKHLRFRPARFLAILILQLLGLLLMLRALPVIFEPGITLLPSWMAVASQLSDRDTWIFYGLVHVVMLLIAWTGLFVIGEAFAGRSTNPYGFYRYQFEQAPISRMMVRIVLVGLFPVAAFAATSHTHPMHGAVVLAYLLALLPTACLAQLLTLVREARNERWLKQLDRGYEKNEAVAQLRARTIRFLQPHLEPIPPPGAQQVLASVSAPAMVSDDDATDQTGSDADSWALAQTHDAARVGNAPAHDRDADSGLAHTSNEALAFPERVRESPAHEAVYPPESIEPQRRGLRWWRTMVAALRFWMLGLVVVILVLGATFAYQWMILPSDVQTRVLAESAHVHVRRSGGEPVEVTLLGTRYDFSLNTRIENVSQHFINAVIASEDHRFFEHGVVYKLSKFGQAALRCVWRVLDVFATTRACRGNSTIGQQLARNLFISEERSLVRKFKELVWSIKMEAGLSKVEILEAYLNRIYLGRGNFGVEMASRSYFGKSASQLSLHEAALLAAAVKRPSWNWHQDRVGAVERAKTIMLVMRRYGYAPANARFPDRWSPRVGSRSLRRPYLGHLWQWIKPRVDEVMADLPPGEYKLLTTLNAEVQVYTRRRLSEAVRRIQAQGVNVSQGAAVVMRPNGAVLAMVGGVGDDLPGRGVNRAKRTDGLFARPPASAFKPVVYLAALEDGLTPESIIEAGPVSIDVPGSHPYAPANHDGKVYGKVTMREALVSSINTAAVHLLHRQVGFDHLFDVATRLGLDSTRFERQWGLALGQIGVPVVDMAGVYAAFANGGYRVTPHAFVAVTNEDGKSVWRRARPRNKRVFNRKIIRQLNGMLEEAVATGTGFRARRRFEKTDRLAGKTGTGDGFVDAWFIGYSADLVIAIWLGNDRPQAMANTYGGGAPAQVFNEIMHDLARHTGLVTLSKPLP